MTLRVLAAGNPVGRDDSAALYVADRLKGQFDVTKAYTAPENFVSVGDEIVLIDAIEFGGKPGEVRIINPLEVYETPNTSHSAFKLIGKVAKKITIIGIQPAERGVGEKLSPPLAEKLDDMAAGVKEILEKLL